MLRFKAKKAFLFYPYSTKNIEKEDVQSNNQTDPVINDFVIDGNEDYHLYKVGLPIPEAENFKEFIISMKEIEASFNNKMTELIKRDTL